MHINHTVLFVYAQSNACQTAAGQRSFMSSLQCLETTEGLITSDLCLPPKDEILRFDSQILDCHSRHTYFVVDDVLL